MQAPGKKTRKPANPNSIPFGRGSKRQEAADADIELVREILNRQPTQDELIRAQEGNLGIPRGMRGGISQSPRNMGGSLNPGVAQFDKEQQAADAAQQRQWGGMRQRQMMSQYFGPDGKPDQVALDLRAGRDPGRADYMIPQDKAFPIGPDGQTAMQIKPEHGGGFGFGGLQPQDQNDLITARQNVLRQESPAYAQTPPGGNMIVAPDDPLRGPALTRGSSDFVMNRLGQMTQEQLPVQPAATAPVPSPVAAPQPASPPVTNVGQPATPVGGQSLEQIMQEIMGIQSPQFPMMPVSEPAQAAPPAKLEGPAPGRAQEPAGWSGPTAPGATPSAAPGAVQPEMGFDDIMSKVNEITQGDPSKVNLDFPGNLITRSFSGMGRALNEPQMPGMMPGETSYPPEIASAAKVLGPQLKQLIDSGDMITVQEIANQLPWDLKEAIGDFYGGDIAYWLRPAWQQAILDPFYEERNPGVRR